MRDFKPAWADGKAQFQKIRVQFFEKDLNFTFSAKDETQ